LDLLTPLLLFSIFFIFSARKKASDELKAMHTQGSTNFWGGLYTGLELLRGHNDAGHLASLMILTGECSCCIMFKIENELLQTDVPMFLLRRENWEPFKNIGRLTKMTSLVQLQPLDLDIT
jgi:hypothetical protein